MQIKIKIERDLLGYHSLIPFIDGKMAMFCAYINNRLINVDLTIEKLLIDNYCLDYIDFRVAFSKETKKLKLAQASKDIIRNSLEALGLDFENDYEWSMSHMISLRGETLVTIIQ